MEKIDARTVKDEALHERRRQVIRLHKRGGRPERHGSEEDDSTL